jgi:hypothetical protein
VTSSNSSFTSSIISEILLIRLCLFILIFCHMYQVAFNLLQLNCPFLNLWTVAWPYVIQISLIQLLTKMTANHRKHPAQIYSI